MGAFNMNISDIRIRLINSGGKLKAVASLTIDECFVIHDIKILEGEESLFIAMPGRKAPNGQYKDIVHPLNTQTREFIKDAVLKAYEAAKEATA